MNKGVGIIGLGLLGGALADRFLQQGWTVSGCDINTECRHTAAGLGVTVLESGSAVALEQRHLLLSLPDGKAVETVLAEIAPALSRKHLVIDTTTCEPGESVGFAEQVRALTADYLDATVAGSSAQARRGEVLVMVGGTPSSVAQAAPVLDAFSNRVFHVGGHGAGSRFKLVHNLMLGLSRAVLAESLTLARALHLDAAKVLEILRASPAAYSRVIDTKGDKMINGDFSAQATVRQHLKDVRLMLSAAAEHDTRLPLSEIHQQLLQSLVDRGLGEQDNSSIIQAFDQDD